MNIKSQVSTLIRKVKDRLDDKGHEVLDPTPVAPPVGFRPAPSLADQIRDMVRSERLARDLAEAGFETFEEADDFNVGDDFEPSSPWEGEFEPVSSLKAKAAADVPPQASPAPMAPATEPAKPATSKPAAEPPASAPKP